nr:MAG: DNA pilot protein [Microviridae sp.]
MANARKTRGTSMSDPLSILMLGAGTAINAGSNIYQGMINQQEQEKNRAMQIDLANTAVQRRQADLKAAGINPLMAGRIGGADTPTLQAPQMTGIGAAGATISSGLSDLTPAAIQKRQNDLTQQQMQIQNTEAETENTKAKTTQALAEAQLTNTTNQWYGPKTQSEMTLQGADTKQKQAQTATIDAMRAPEVNKVIQDTATSLAQQQNTQQKTKTEQQITDETTQAAKYAAQKYKSQASEAQTIAETAAYKYIHELPVETQQKIDQKDLQNQLLTSENFGKVLDNILKTDYGRPIEWAKIPLAQQAGIAITAGKNFPNPTQPVTTQPVPGRR